MRLNLKLVILTLIFTFVPLIIGVNGGHSVANTIEKQSINVGSLESPFYKFNQLPDPLVEVNWNPEKAAEYYRLALNRKNNGQNKEAIKLLEEAKQADPYSLETLNMLHQLHVANGDYDLAYQSWLDKYLFEISVLDLPQVKEWNERYYALITNAVDEEFHYKLGLLYKEMFLLDEAVIELKMANHKELIKEVSALLSFKQKLTKVIKEKNQSSYKELEATYSEIAFLFPEFTKEQGLIPWIEGINNGLEHTYNIKFASGLGYKFVGLIIFKDSSNISQFGNQRQTNLIFIKDLFSQSDFLGTFIQLSNEIIIDIDNIYKRASSITLYNPAWLKANGYDIEQHISSLRYSYQPLDIYGDLNLYLYWNYLGIHNIVDNIAMENRESNQSLVLEKAVFKLLRQWFNQTLSHEIEHALTQNIELGGIEGEYKSRLASLIEGDNPQLLLASIYRKNINSKFEKFYISERQIFEDIIYYIYEHPKGYPQIDPKLNILAQLHRLTKEQLNEIAFEIYKMKYPKESY